MGNKKRILVCGDIHGSYYALKDVLETANFDYENDMLIQLGDVSDGWSQTKEVIDELLKIKNLVYILGNHDEWSMEYYKGEMLDTKGNIQPNVSWFTQGGESTIESLGEYHKQDPKYLAFFESGKMYYKISSNNEDGTVKTKIFAHGNIPSRAYNMSKLVEKNMTYEFIWERSLIMEAARKRKSWSTVDKRFDEIYLGHSCVGYLMSEEEHQYKPQKMTNVWGMDTNAAYDGKLSLMDIRTKEIFQSDFVCKYHPDERGRNGESYNDYLKRGGDPK